MSLIYSNTLCGLSYKNYNINGYFITSIARLHLAACFTDLILQSSFQLLHLYQNFTNICKFFISSSSWWFLKVFMMICWIFISFSFLAGDGVYCITVHSLFNPLNAFLFNLSCSSFIMFFLFYLMFSLY